MWIVSKLFVEHAPKKNSSIILGINLDFIEDINVSFWTFSENLETSLTTTNAQ